MSIISWSDSQVLAQLDSGYTWSGLTITYSFPATSSGMYSSDGAELPGFHAAGSEAQAMMRIALQTWDDLIAPNFQQGTPGFTNIEVGFSSTGIGYAHAYYPDAGSVWLNSAYTSGYNDLDGGAIGSHGFDTYIHELGHALGLEHMGNYNGSGAWTPSSYQDSTVFSVMSYFGPTAPNRSPDVAQADWIGQDGNPYAPQTPMLNDIMAIQAMYGASTTTRTGDTVYGFNSNVTGAVAPVYDFNSNRNPIITLFDSGGVDTLDLSGWGTPSIINLASGSFSSANWMTNNIAIAYSAVIENGVGGSGPDVITGNGFANSLSGNAGNDNLLGANGNDTLAGGPGNDVLDGGAGTDTGVFGGAYASYTITYNAVTATYQLVNASTGTDTATGLEFFQFADQTRSAQELFSSDTTAPVLGSSSPADGATGVGVAANIVLSFNESVQAGTGNIVIYNGNGTVARTISVTDSSQVSFQGSTVTINPSANLAAGSYYVLVAGGAIKDLAGNAWAGIASTTALNFTTSASDTVAPVLLGTAPIDNATQVPVGGNLTLTFSEPVRAGSGNIVIFNGNGTVARTISVNDAAQVSFDGSTLVINPLADLAYGANYYVTMASGVVVDSGGNPYAGISASTAFNFSTVASSLVDDYTDTSSTGGLVLTNGSTTGGVINFTNDADWFRVVLQAGVTYTFDMVSTGLPDPLMFLLDAAGTVYAGDDDDGDGLNARFEYTPSESGTYYLEAWDAGLGTGAYAITVTSGADDFPWSTTTTGVVTVNGAATPGVINFTDDLDLLKVTLVAGQSYVFDMTSAGLADPLLFLYDPSLNLVAQDDDSGGSMNSRIEFIPSVSGTYYLGAADYGTGTGAYTLRASQTGDDYPYSTATTGVVSVGGSALAGDIDYAGDLDLVKITLTQGVTYRIDLTRTSGGLEDPYLRLFEPDLDLAAYDDDSAGSKNSRITYTAPATGTYYLGISDYDTGTGGYTVSAAVLDVTAPVLQTTSPADNASGVAVGANLSLTFNENVQAGSGNILIYNSSGTVARAIPVTDTSQVTFSGHTLTVNPSSDLSFGSGYYVNIGAGVVTDTAGNAYAGLGGTTAFNFTTAAPTATDDFPLATSTGGVVTVNGAGRAGAIDYAYDGDMFKVSLVAGTSYRFDLNRTASGGLADPYLQLFGPDLELAAVDDDGGDEGNSRLYFTASTTGTYYLAAWDYATGTGKYTLSAAAATDDHPWSKTSAPLVPIGGGPSTGAIDFAGDGDLFKMTMSAGVTYVIDLKASGSGLDDPFLYLYNSSLVQLAFDDDSAGALNSRVVYTAAASGTYYLGAFDFASGTGAYTLEATVATVVNGTTAADSLVGGGGAEVMRGLAGADALRGNGGNDHIDGGDGIDVAVFANSRANYQVAVGHSAAVVTALTGSDGTDTLVDVERLQFADGKTAIDIDGHAGVVAKTLGAVFGAAAVGNEAYAGIGLALMDGGMSYAALMQMALDVRLGAGAGSNAVVTLLYTNVIGVAPDAATLASFTGLLTSGLYTPGTLGVLAADTPANAAQVGLAGLAVTGLDYI